MGFYPFSASSGTLTPYPDQLAALQYGLTSGAPVTSLLAAIANRNAARVDIPVIGDSVTEGQGASSFSGTWIQQANRAIRAAYPTTANGTAGGLGFIPIQSSGSSSFTWPVTVTGTPGSFDFGPVRNCTQCTSATTWTWTAPAGTTSVKIVYYDAGLGGEFSWQVGSGTITNVTNAGTLIDVLTSSISITGGEVLTIAYVAGTLFLDGLLHFAGDEDSGITFHACGHFGWAAETWNTPEIDGLNWEQAYNVFSPASFGIMLGINDADASGDARTAFQFQTDVSFLNFQLRSGATSLSGLPILLIAQYQADETFADTGGWPAYVAALRNVPLNDPVGARFIDLSYRMPTVSSLYDGGALYSDSVHPSIRGHALLGEIVAATLRIA